MAKDVAVMDADPHKGKVVNHLLQVQITCKGITPLLMNPMSDEQLLQLWTKEKGSKNAPRPQPHEAAQKAVKKYTDPDGKIYVPAHCLYSCLVGAGRYVRLDGKRQISTKADTSLPLFMGIETPMLYLITPFKPGWDTDIRQGRNPNGGEAVAIVRPRFDEWSLKVKIWIDTKEIAEEKIRELFDKAGKIQGLLDFRPSRKGIYGQFIVECWKRIS